jgi:CubicO group peptidase (beta-lactamase class C family)
LPCAPERAVFEIGSITKVFTSLLLAIAVERGEVGLDDPLVEHLPRGTRVPMRAGRPITLVNLATHTPGLPRLPPGFLPRAISPPLTRPRPTVERRRR